MIDKKLHTALNELEENLKNISSAKQQIDEIKGISSDVISSIFDLQKDYSDYLTSSENSFQKAINEYKESLEIFINEISNKQNDIALLSTKTIENSKNEFKHFIEKQRKEIDTFHTDIVSTTNKIIKDSFEAIEKSKEEYIKVFQVQNNQINEHIQKYASFVEKVRGLLEYIEKVNFPSRLEKIDNTVSSINVGLLNLQGSVNDVRREQKEQLNQLKNELISKQKKENQKIKNLLYTITGIITITAILVIYQIFKQ